MIEWHIRASEKVGDPSSRAELFDAGAIGLEVVLVAVEQCPANGDLSQVVVLDVA